MRVVITGATGAIGSALIYECIKQEIEVLVLCRKESSRNGNIPSHSLVRVVECSLDQLAELPNDEGRAYDVFFHFAWAGTNGSGRNDLYMQNRNVKYALDAVDAAVRFGCHMFIGAGSQAEYGRVDTLLSPDTPTFPETGYGIAKLCAGQMTREYARQKGLKHVWLRFLSVYGPNDGKQSLVMSIIDALQRGECPKCTKGEQLWDYLYSKDAARACIAIAERGKDGKVYVLGSGKQRLLADYICEIRDVAAPGRPIEFGAIPYNDHQVMYLCADIGEVVKDTGWEPQTEFRDGICDTIANM